MEPTLQPIVTNMNPSIQPSNPIQSDKKNHTLLIIVELLFIILLIVGFIMGNKSGRSNSTSDLLSLVGIILIIPSFILSLIGIKDASVSFKDKTGNGFIILIISLALLGLSIFLGFHFYQTIRFLI